MTAVEKQKLEKTRDAIASSEKEKDREVARDMYGDDYTKVSLPL